MSDLFDEMMAEAKDARKRADALVRGAQEIDELRNIVRSFVVPRGDVRVEISGNPKAVKKLLTEAKRLIGEWR